MVGLVTPIGANSLLDKMEPTKLGALSNGAKPVAGPSFDQVLTDIGTKFGDTLNKAESLSVAKMAGQDVGLRDVVNSVMEAERALTTAIALRDKMVHAYTEISRMQI